MTRGSSPSPFRGFVAVAALGFAIDATLLTVLVSVLGWSNYAGRAASFFTAITVTWLCNRLWVFGRTEDARREYAAYLITQLFGATINLGGFALLLELLPSLQRMPIVALAGGGILAMIFNYFAVRRWVFVDTAMPTGGAVARRSANRPEAAPDPRTPPL